MEDYNSAQAMNSPIPLAETTRLKRASSVWSKPKGKLVKVNWDATSDHAVTGRVGIGVIARDSKGEILACLCSIENLSTSPLVVEAAALRRAMYFCIELGLKR